MSQFIRSLIRSSTPLRRPYLNRNASTPVLLHYSSYATASSPTTSQAAVPEFLVDEPVRPQVITQEIPGPLSVKAIARLDKVFDTRSLNTICDYEHSVGNFLSDVDGNVCNTPPP